MTLHFDAVLLRVIGTICLEDEGVPGLDARALCRVKATGLVSGLRAVTVPLT
jgi:hypothetical protein